MTIFVTWQRTLFRVFLVFLDSVWSQLINLDYRLIVGVTLICLVLLGGCGDYPLVLCIVIYPVMWQMSCYYIYVAQRRQTSSLFPVSPQLLSTYVRYCSRLSSHCLFSVSACATQRERERERERKRYGWLLLCWWWWWCCWWWSYLLADVTTQLVVGQYTTALAWPTVVVVVAAASATGRGRLKVTRRELT